MPTFTDRTSRLLKHTKADKPKMGVGIPDYNDGYEGETRIQMVEGNPRLYLKTNAGWFFTGLVQDGAIPDIPTASSTQLGVIKIGSGGTVSSDGTYTATAATPPADDITGGDSAVTITTSSGNITIDAAANNSNIIFKGTDASADITMLTLSGADAGAATFNNKIVATELDISGNVDIDGTLETDALTINGTTLAETISDTVGAMVSSNTESGITVAYQDADNTLDFTVGTLNQDTTGNAATATALETARNIGGVSFNGTANINLPGVNTGGNQDTTGNAATITTAAASGSSTHYLCFVDGTSGAQDIKVRNGVSVNPSTDVVTVGGIVIGDGGMTFGDNVDIGSFELRAQTLQSDVSTGTAPLTIASTTVVSNLNADKLDGADLVDEDNFSSNSATKVPTQQSVKAYVDGAYTAGTGLAVSSQVFSLSHLGLQSLSDPNADRVLGWDDSAGVLAWFTLNTGIEASGTNINASTGPTAGTGLNSDGSEFTVDVSDFMTNGSNNRIVTATGADAMNAEANLTFDGSTLALTGAATVSSTLAVTSNITTDGIFKVDSAPDGNVIEFDQSGRRSAINVYFASGSTGSKLVSRVSNGSTDNSMIDVLDLRPNQILSSNTGTASVPAYSFTDDTNIGMYRGAADTLRFATGGAERLEITDSQTKVTGIFKATSTIRGDADVVAYYSSDPSLKENKKLIQSPLDKISQLGVYSFDWKDEARDIVGDHLNGKDYGVMADEVQALFPELVDTRSNGIRAVKYDKLVPLLIEGIKELKEELNMIKEQS